MRDSDLPAPSRHLALTLATYTGRKCRRPFVSIGTLAQKTGLGRSTVLKHMKLLTEEDGRFVRKERRQDEAGRTTSNEYRLVIPTGEGRVHEIDPPVHEIDPPVHEIDPRGSSRWTGEGPANGPEGCKDEGSNKKDTESEHETREDIGTVWTHYLTRYADRYSEERANRLKLTACQRDQHLRARFREGYTVEDLRTAIDGCFDDPWHKERQKDELEYIVRNQGKVEDFLKKAERNGTKGAPVSTNHRDALSAIDQGGRGE